MSLFSLFGKNRREASAARADLQPLLNGWVKDRQLRSLLVSEDAFNYFRSLENEISLVEPSQRMALLLTSPGRGDGRTTASLLLALLSGAYAPALQTVYVDASESSLHIAKSLALDPHRPGFYGVLDGSATLDEATQVSPLANLAVISGGSASAGRKRFDAARFAMLCEDLKSRYHRVIIDAPAIETHREVLVMTKSINNVILVLRCRRTPRALATLALNELESVGANVIGTILNERVFPVPGTRGWG